ncbi:MAG TPA: hypothetical protein VFA55_03135, partial [Candidatus Kapabacteria bacterium]|nr:hypothetical protein [Candidatus Kapabacteria bacterium]
EQAQETMTKAGEKADYDPSSVDRVFVWIDVLNMELHASNIQRFTGIGPGNFYDYMRPYMILHSLYTGIPGNSINGAHDNYIHIFVELGAGGLILFGIFMTGIFRKFWNMRKQSDIRLNTTANIVVAGTVALLISGFTQETFYSQPAMGNFMGFYLVVIVLLLSLIQKQQNDIITAS